ncbi:MAG: cysteine desulfurase family protein [Xanthobacteraceae bacterium]
MTERIYLDWNATAPLRPQARAATVEALDLLGNPSSVHGEGRAARHLVEGARRQVAALVGADPESVTFTSGGTEANALALTPSTPGEVLLVSSIEHPSVLAGGRFDPAQVRQVPVTADGRLDLAALTETLLAAGRPALVSLMAANNETGVLQPVSQAAAIVHEAGGRLHVDAVQAAGRIPLHINEIGADLITVSSHKLGGPKGAGALIRRSQVPAVEPLIRGGGQERGARAGTENVAAIAGFGAAAAAAMAGLAAEAAHMAALRDRLEQGLRSISPEAVVFGQEAVRLPNTTLFSVPAMKAETAVIAFDLAGVAVSSGAACSSGKVTPSHVLAAMGVPPPLARGAVRISLGPTTTESEVDRFLEAWRKLFQSLTVRRDIAA